MKYLEKFNSMFKTNLGHESGDQMVSWMRKIVKNLAQVYL
jgi:hypothetical protein